MSAAGMDKTIGVKMDDFFDKWDSEFVAGGDSSVVEELEEHFRQSALAGEGILPRWALY